MVKPLATVLCALVAGSTVSLALAGTASARSMEDILYSHLHEQGIVMDPNVAWYAAIDVCDAAENGQSPAAVRQNATAKTGLTGDQLGVFVAVAIDDMCPEFSGTV